MLSSGVVLSWPYADDLGIQTSGALAAATSLTSGPTFAFGAMAELSAGGSPSTGDNVLALIPLVL